jgi:hypothetical protein
LILMRQRREPHTTTGREYPRAPARPGPQTRTRSVLFCFGLATQTKRQSPRSTGRRNDKSSRAFWTWPKPQPRKRIQLLFQWYCEGMRFSARSPSPSPVRRYVWWISVNHIRLGVPNFSAEGEVSPTGYNPLLIRPQVRRRMTRKRTRLIPMSTALAAVAVHLYMIG